MNKGIMIFWSVLLGANLGLAIFIARWIIREFASDVKDAVRTASAWDRWDRIGGNSDLLMLKHTILDEQKESETSLKKYITEQLSEDKTLGSAVKLDGEMYVIVSVSKDVATGEVASADISLRKAVE